MRQVRRYFPAGFQHGERRTRAGLSHADARSTAQWGPPGNAAEKRVSARPLDKCSIRPIYIASGAI